jgi:hypothetical protein
MGNCRGGIGRIMGNRRLCVESCNKRTGLIFFFVAAGNESGAQNPGVNGKSVHTWPQELEVQSRGVPARSCLEAGSMPASNLTRRGSA